MEHLKAPVPGVLPYGIYLKGDKATYRALRNAFNASQTAWRSLSETQESLEDRELGAANTAAWEALAEKAEICLIETSKDLEVLTWFAASQAHGVRAFQRFAEALTLIADLVEESIEQLQPSPPLEKLKGDTDEERAAEVAELRLRPFVQLVGEVEGSGLLTGPVTASSLIGEITYGKFVLADKNGDLDSLLVKVGSAIGTEAVALTQKIEALQEMVRQFDRLDAKLKTYALQHGKMPPLIGYGRRLAVDVLAAIERLVEGLGFPWPGAEEESEEADAEANDVEAGAVADDAASRRTRVGGGFDLQANVTGRSDALSAIAKLAKFFRTTEPHSPICLLLDRAVRWGNLSAGELYREILSEGSVGMSQMALMTGLESQGFSDHFGTRGAAAAGGVEHPTLPDYNAALPVPSESFAAAAQVGAVVPALAEVQTQPAAQNKIQVDPQQEAAETKEAEPVIDNDSPVDDFQW